MREGSIYSDEIRNATLLWLYVIQHRKYHEVLNDIEKHRKNCIQQQLGVKIDDIGPGCLDVMEGWVMLI